MPDLLALNILTYSFALHTPTVCYRTEIITIETLALRHTIHFHYRKLASDKVPRTHLNPRATFFS